MVAKMYEIAEKEKNRKPPFLEKMYFFNRLSKHLHISCLVKWETPYFALLLDVQVFQTIVSQHLLLLLFILLQLYLKI